MYVIYTLKSSLLVVMKAHFESFTLIGKWVDIFFGFDIDELLETVDMRLNVVNDEVGDRDALNVGRLRVGGWVFHRCQTWMVLRQSSG